jgi:nucleoside transporter
MVVSTLPIGTERLLATLFALGSVLLLAISSQDTYPAIFALVFVYSLLYMPTLGLVPALALRHLPDPARGFARARAMGTVGWIVGGLVIGGFRLEQSATSLRLSAAVSLALAAYCLTLPHTPPVRSERRRTLSQLLGLDALSLARDPVMLLFLSAGLVIGIPTQMYNAFGALYLAELGAPRPAALLTLGQCTEVFVIIALPLLRERLGLRGLLALGTTAWLVRSLIFASASQHTLPLILCGLLLHGVAFSCVYVAGNLMVHERAPESLRTEAQGLWTMVAMGLGNLIGALVAGRAVDAFARGTGAHAWDQIWRVSAGAAAAMLVILAAAWAVSRGASARR